MKQKLLFVGAMLLASISYGQKVDIDKEAVTFEYRDLPSKPLKPEYKTYSIMVDAFPTISAVYSQPAVVDGINIQGLKKITDGAKGHVIISVTLGDLMITNNTVTERVEVRKDKDGKETGRSYFYKVELKYTWTGKSQIADYNGTSIGYYNSEGVMPTTKSWTSDEHSSYNAATAYYNDNRTAIRGNLVRGQVSAYLSDLSIHLSNTYGYPTRKDYEYLWILDSKKHPEYQIQQDTWEAFKATMAKVNADEFPAETKEKLAEIIKYFDGIPAKYAADEKPDKKLRYASYFNKAKIYLYLDNPDAAIKEADALIANEYDDGDGKRLKKEADALIELFKKNNSNSRHFPIDLSQVQGPGTN
jgi:hypothetical protein